ncbi:oxidoreductase domain protein [[Leptolyngbya] sp. PCC 7376]|uniref:Gfo/Idh/MocA family protein n=1 Tax=[Leptolyngbya] sp. PCC 7376 TaxID=111781 RepID=UPI00029EC8FA|nr:Gfo/Idh/MocA family oxidoreductase [[Leptolyngbya] sp. PCC 7376]AFY38395.1 oxidoreductase domain protein [[Leptolyngbya] sp. PCC 7376]
MTALRVGIVGTGYAAKRRADAFQQEQRSQLIAVTGHRESSRQSFAAIYGIEAIATWQELVQRPDLDIVVVCNINRKHGAIARAALEADKHVVVEYPLALDPTEAAEIVELARTKKKLLHVEHIEILGGLHQTIREYLPKLGQIFFAKYMTLAPKRHPLPHWTFHHKDYGFPLVAALSRVNRFIDLFGEVDTVQGTADFLPSEFEGYYKSCLCAAQFKFQSGVVAHLTYGKGSLVTTGDRRFTIYGDKGTLEFNGSQGTLTQGETTTPIKLGSRRGVFLRDTTAVLDYLIAGKPLYIQPEQSLYALKIADQIRHDTLK